MNEIQRRRILERDGHVCKLGPHEDDTYRLDVHHFKDLVPGIGFINAYEQEQDKDMVTLCRRCHGALKTSGRSRNRWSIRRRLTLIMYGIDIGPCQIHRWQFINGETRCINSECGIVKSEMRIPQIPQNPPQNPSDKIERGVVRK